MRHSPSLRALLLLPMLALGGCSLWDDWFGTEKVPLPGDRKPVLTQNAGLKPAAGLKISLPPPAANADWQQAGGTTAHVMEHPALRDGVTRAWSSSIGAGAGYRARIMAQPIVAAGMVFTMDSDAAVAAFDAASGRQVWSAATAADNDRSTNIGGGIAFADGAIYAATGRGEVVAIGATDGKLRWRGSLGAPARAAPTVAAGKLFIPLLDNQVVAISATDGGKLWSYQGRGAEPVMLGMPSPAYAEGILIAGFGSGELVALNPQTGAVIWADSLAASRGRNSLADVSTIMGRPAVKAGRVLAVSLGQTLAALDLRSGRRLWERDISSAESPWIAGDWAFVVTTDAQVVAVSLADGQIAWVTQLEVWGNVAKKKDPITWYGPVLAGDRLIVSGSNGTAASISPYSGQVLGTQSLSAGAAVTPSVAGGTLFIVTDNGAVAAFR